MSEEEFIEDHLSPSQRKRLNETISDSDLSEIADEIIDWDEKLIEPLNLKEDDIREIRQQDLKIQRFEPFCIMIPAPSHTHTHTHTHTQTHTHTHTHTRTHTHTHTHDEHLGRTLCQLVTTYIIQQI